MIYRVYLSTVPGMFAQYSGYVDVNAFPDEDIEEIVFRAKQKVRRGAFPDYSNDMFRADKLEIIG